MTQIYKAGSGGGGSGIITINGDVGSITGSVVTIYANNAANNSGSSVEFVNSGTISTLNLSDTHANTILGFNSGLVGTAATESGGVGSGSLINADTGATKNYFLGNSCLSSLTTGDSNIAAGFNALNATVSDSNCIAIGDNTLSLLNGGGGNCLAIGAGALQNSLTDSFNLAIGLSALFQLDGSGSAINNTAVGPQCMASAAQSFNCCGFGFNTLQAAGNGHNLSAFGFQALSLNSGNYNIGIGSNVGSNLTGTESGCVLLNSSALTGENNVLRIGENTGTGNQDLTSAYVQGIYSTSQDPSGTVQVVTINNTTGLLGVTNSTGLVVWSDQGSDFTAANLNGYFITAPLTATLPLTATEGTTISFINVSAGLTSFIILANSGQTIRIGSVTTNLAGSITSTQNGDSITLVYNAATLVWFSLGSPVGTWNFA